jgi:hypothetical protein
MKESHLRQRLVDVAKRAFLREPPFDIIDRIAIPPFCDLTCRGLTKEDARRQLRFDFILTKLSLLGHDSPAVSERVVKHVESLNARRTPRPQQESIQILPSLAEFRATRKECLQAANRALREMFRKPEWSPMGARRFEAVTPSGPLRVVFDAGTYRTTFSILLHFPTLSDCGHRLVLDPGRLFYVAVGQTFDYLAYQDAGAFDDHLRKVLQLLDLLLVELRRPEETVLRKN